MGLMLCFILRVAQRAIDIFFFFFKSSAFSQDSPLTTYWLSLLPSLRTWTSLFSALTGSQSQTLHLILMAATIAHEMDTAPEAIMVPDPSFGAVLSAPRLDAKLEQNDE